MNAVESHPITKSLLESAMSYSEYIELLDQLFEASKTTGENQSEDMLGYTKMNIHRMKRLNKTIALNEDLLNAVKKYDEQAEETVFLMITEGWCGDAAQNLPLLNELVENSSKISLKLILRDENLDIMDAFLTNGGRSIPKLIALTKDDLSVIGTWGPRPNAAQSMVTEFKKVPDGDYKEFVKEVQLWYARDKTQSQQTEMVQLLNKWAG